MDTKTKAIFAQVIAQRNNALDMVAELVGVLAERDATIASLQPKEALTPPPADPSAG